MATPVHLPPGAAAIVSKIIDEFSPDRIVMFGSYARGDAGPDSDLDLLVVFDDLPRTQKRERAKAIYRSLLRVELPVDIIVANRHDMTSNARRKGLIYLPALREGIPVYERS